MWKFKLMAQIEYDSCMPERVAVRVRCLPDGVFSQAFEIPSDGRFLELDVTGNRFPLGSLVEIEKGSMLYWGELKQWVDRKALVWIEHSLDRSKLQPIRETWGE